MDEIKSDALVFFGATGDLAYKKIFPALQSMIKRGHLDVPVIGVAKAGWTLEQLHARARDSLDMSTATTQTPRRSTPSARNLVQPGTLRIILPSRRHCSGRWSNSLQK